MIILQGVFPRLTKILTFSSLGVICFALFAWNSPPVETPRYHTGGDDEPWLPFGYNQLFAGSGQCVECHGHDTEGLASVTAKGEDVNVVDAWRSTMMANSAKDPFWRAKVSHETTVNPQLQVEIEDKCTACHAPLGHFNAHYIKQDYSMAELAMDSLGLDGVSCLACHQQSVESLETSFSGDLIYSTEAVAYGQYVSPLASPMIQFAQYTPVFSEHIEDAAICAGCHTLITGTVDLNGEFTGDEFVEQATYHEWLNSTYSAEDEAGITCQGCHMPSLGAQEINLIAGFETPPRTPYYLHEFAGANTLMLKLMKENAQELGIAATDEDFDATINSTLNLLQSESLELSIELWERYEDTSHFDVKLSNLVGHKFPSGYPSRRLVVEFVVEDDLGDVIFSSGSYEDDYSLALEDEPFEPHFDVIRDESEIQIYEMVMGDIDGNFTTVLDLAYVPLKDNRLVPVGFTTTHPAYDTTLMAGAVLDDDDFNMDLGSEGSGTDEIRYSVPMNGYTGALTAYVNVHYQSLPPRWMEEIFEVDTEEINYFEEMFYNADQSPVLVEQAETFVDVFVAVGESTETAFDVYPTLGHGQLRFLSEKEVNVKIYGHSGKLVADFLKPTGLTIKNLTLAPGGYLVVFDDGAFTKRIVITNE